MKKYFVVETDEICEFGDELHLNLFKEIEGGKVTVEKDVEFNENTMGLLIEMGFVEEREVNPEDLIDFENGDEDDPCEALANLMEDFEALERRVDMMSELVKEIYDYIKEKEEPKKDNVKPKKGK